MKQRHLVCKRWSPEQSSNVAEVRYYGKPQHLDITFQNGKQYRYFGVPVSIFKNAYHAASVGTYVSQCIKGSYQYEQQ